MHYIFIIFLLLISILLYFKIADRYNIIDRPNHRSAHTEITLRGGGIIFPVAFLLFMASELLFKNQILSSNFWIFGVGLLLICGVSFIDDIMDLSTKIRLVFHFVSVSLLLYFLNIFQILPLWSIPICYILIIGILNAYNFMDGINGMSGLYTLVILSSLAYVNHFLIPFVDKNFIIYPLIASVVFLYFNFRKKAKCFLGDVGSMGIAFWIIALLVLLMIKTGEYKWFLFLAVYGVETILTIIERLKLKENIFDAHRRHLYQLLVHERNISHLWVSSMYAFLQLIINLLVIFCEFRDWVHFCVFLCPTILFYLYIKPKLAKTAFQDKINP